LSGGNGGQFFIFEINRSLRNKKTKKGGRKKMAGKDSYKDEIIDPGDQASAMAKEICFESHGNCSAVTIVPHQPDNFRGPVGFVWAPHVLKMMAAHTRNRRTKQITDWLVMEEVENDGAGGKLQFSTLVGTPQVFARLGWEIICMTADDFARTGRLACIIDNAIDTKRITAKNFHLFEAMMRGLGLALAKVGLVNITGEVAIMKHSVTAFCDTGADDQLIVNWGASCVGLAHRALLIDGSAIKTGMPIVGFWEPGYRCNGGTFFTNLILQQWGSDIDEIRNNPEAMEFVEKLTVPSTSYARTISRILGWKPNGSIKKPLAQVKGIAHITGGGLAKLKEILPEGVGARLYAMPKPADVLLQAQELSWETDLQLTDKQAHTTLHGGCGMMVVCSNHGSADRVIREASKDGIPAQIIGKTVNSTTNVVLINSRFKEGAMVTL
jgi:phosphoribosylaminoimidazole (AIR) synthetase